MKKLYEKSLLGFALVWIGIYCILQSVANPLNTLMGINYSASAIFCILQTAVLLYFVIKNRLLQEYGLCKSSVSASRFLFYIPLAILVTRNFWNGAAVNMGVADTICYLVYMLCVGFVEEIIFRGFLFKAIAKDNVKAAIIVSSVTFGLGHLLNLVKGSDATLVENLFQVTGAIAIGFLFVVLFYRGGSLLPCIIAHSVINMASAFANETGLTMEKQIIFQVILFVIAIGYAVVLTKTLPKAKYENNGENENEHHEKQQENMIGILYFSGTGNSLYIAQKVQSKLGGQIKYIPSYIGNVSEFEQIVLVTPIYSYGMPTFVYDLIPRLNKSTEIIIIQNYGGIVAGADYYIYQYALKHRLNIKAVYTLKMPENFTTTFTVPRFYINRTLKSADKRIDKVIDRIALEDYRIPKKRKTKEKVYLKNKSNWHLIGERFSVTDKCIKCGKCVSVCPVKNISMNDNHITFSNKCVACLGCYHRCPQKAIVYKGNKKTDRYVNPYVKESEIGQDMQ